MTDLSGGRPRTTPPSLAARRTLRLIALFEALKGVVVLGASIGLLSLLHHDLREIALALIGRFDLNPDARYPSAFLHYADLLQNASVRTVVALAVCYAAVRLAEAYGLWHDRAWGEWLGALSGMIYVPFEVRHFVHRPSFLGLAFVAANVLIVAFLVFLLWRRKATRLKREN